MKILSTELTLQIRELVWIADHVDRGDAGVARFDEGEDRFDVRAVPRDEGGEAVDALDRRGVAWRVRRRGLVVALGLIPQAEHHAGHGVAAVDGAGGGGDFAAAVCGEHDVLGQQCV